MARSISPAASYALSRFGSSAVRCSGVFAARSAASRYGDPLDGRRVRAGLVLRVLAGVDERAVERGTVVGRERHGRIGEDRADLLLEAGDALAPPGRCSAAASARSRARSPRRTRPRRRAAAGAGTSPARPRRSGPAASSIENAKRSDSTARGYERRALRQRLQRFFDTRGSTRRTCPPSRAHRRARAPSWPTRRLPRTARRPSSKSLPSSATVAPPTQRRTIGLARRVDDVEGRPRPDRVLLQELRVLRLFRVDREPDELPGALREGLDP